MFSQPDIERILEDPVKVLTGIQRQIEKHTPMPPVNSSALALLVAATYLDEGMINTIIDTVPPEKRNGLVEYLNLLAKAPVSGGNQVN